MKSEDWPIERIQSELQRREKGAGARGECKKQCPESCGASSEGLTDVEVGAWKEQRQGVNGKV